MNQYYETSNNIPYDYYKEENIYNYISNIPYMAHAIDSNRQENVNTIHTNKLYDPYNGFIRGNIFKNLYNPYKVDALPLRATNQKEHMLNKIRETDFYAHELNLYLDLYPNDINIIELFNKYREENEKLIESYEIQYGPLNTNSNILNEKPWKWINGPWPWEGER